MLKIDVIKFEAQDVITTSVANGNPLDVCDCIKVANGSCSLGDENRHVIGEDVNHSAIYCDATKHSCNK